MYHQVGGLFVICC